MRNNRDPSAEWQACASAGTIAVWPRVAPTVECRSGPLERLRTWSKCHGRSRSTGKVSAAWPFLTPVAAGLRLREVQQTGSLRTLVIREYTSGARTPARRHADLHT